MRHGDDLSSDEVVEPIHRVGVDEAIADPNARPHHFSDFPDDVESVLNPVFVDLRTWRREEEQKKKKKKKSKEEGEEEEGEEEEGEEEEAE